MARGGKRENAGRPVGTGKFGEPTKAMRVPVSKIQDVLSMLINENDKRSQILTDSVAFFTARMGTKRLVPFYSSLVAAGNPAVVDDDSREHIDLNEHLLNNPNDTYYVRATGESMIGAGIFPGDLLVVDHSIPPQSGKIVIAAVNGELTVKRLFKDRNNTLYLMPENPKFESIEITDDMDFVIWGVVTNAIHKF